MRHITIIALFLLIALSASSQSNRLYWWQMKWSPVDGHVYVPASNTDNGRVDLYRKDSIDLDTRIDSFWTSADTLYARVTRLSGGVIGPVDTLFAITGFARQTGLNDSIAAVRTDIADSLTGVIRSGDDISELNNDAGYITSVAWDEIGGNQTDIDLNGFSNTDNFLKSGDNISELDNDSGYLTGNQSITLSGDITGSGSTGINTTIANNAVSDVKLRTSAQHSVIGRSGNGVGNVADISATTTNHVLRLSGTLDFGLLSLASTQITSGRIPYGISSVLGSSSNFIFTGSQLGIGATPSFDIDIQSAASEMRIRSTVANSPTYVAFNNTVGNYFFGAEGTGGGGLMTGSLANAFVLNNFANVPIQFGTANTVAFTISGSGQNIGIGTNAPTSKLDVNGDIETTSSNAIYLGDPTTDGTWRIIRSGNDLLSQRRESGSYVTKQTITP